MDSQNSPASGGGDLTQYRLGMIEKTLQAISDNLAQLATLEHKHIETRDALARAFKQQEKFDERLRSVEYEMPALKMVRKWVIGGVVGMSALIGMELLKLLK
jgi:hypothetical protein